MYVSAGLTGPSASGNDAPVAIGVIRGGPANAGTPVTVAMAAVAPAATPRPAKARRDSVARSVVSSLMRPLLVAKDRFEKLQHRRGGVALPAVTGRRHASTLEMVADEFRPAARTPPR